MAEEEKGFVIKDKRAFDKEGKLKEAPTEEKEKKEEPTKKAAPGEKSEPPPPPLPAANFTSLIFSLSSTALLHFGEIADPKTGEKKKDLPMAKHAIDTISMLKDKTKGNLTDEEQKFLDSVLTDLRWRYVKAAK